MLKIRPHHLQCIKYFIGNGYSEEFIKNMKSIINRLKEDESFILVKENDDICSSCPFYKGNKCETEEKVQRYDQLILEKLNLEINKEYTDKLIEDRLKEMNLLSCCKDCSWINLCQEIEKNK